MSKRYLGLFAIALTVLFTAYVGYRFYDNHIKQAPIGKAIEFEDSKEIESTNRTVLQREAPVAQLPREVARRSSSLTSPVWAYTPEKRDSGAIDSVKIISLATDVVGFHATELHDRQTYRLPLPKEKTLLEGDVISAQEVIHIIFTTPENAPDFPPPSLEKRPIPQESPIPYPLIAKAFDSPDDATLGQLRDWIKSVGGAARAQSLLEAAELSHSIRIETSTIFRQ